MTAEAKAEEYPKAKLVAKGFMGYGHDFTDGAMDKNEFEITRMYLGAKFDFSENMRAAIIPDLAPWRVPGVTVKDDGTPFSATEDKVRGDFSPTLKAAYLEYGNLLNVMDTPVIKAVRFGQADLWIPFAEGAWKYRFVQKIILDQEGKMLSTDLGLFLEGDMPSKFGGYHLAVVNGEGWHAPEANKFKHVYARFTLVPAPWIDLLAKLSLSGMLFVGDKEKDKEVNRFAGLISYAYAPVSVGFEPAWTSDAGTKGFGWSAFGEVALPADLSVFGRFQSWDADTEKDRDAYSRIVAGVAHRYNAYVRTALDYQGRIFQDDGKKTEHGLFVHTELVY
ncbi:MAG: hypothetical protein HYT87_16840 [Nitrospirae bacterium]|nr:hypothetical protein [Nitrospirota bacterium]